jgi:DNA-binding GntR family transcriptional regulator
MAKLVPVAPLGLTLRQQVLDRLRDAIINGDLAPGEYLRQDQLAAWLGVSSTPVREAIADLAREQLVDLEPNRGARVHPLTRQGTIQFLRTYRLLFEAGYAWGLPELRAPDYRTISKLTDDLERCCKDADYRPAFEIDFSIHKTVFDAAGNADLSRLLTALRPRVHRLLNLRMPDSVWDDNPRVYRKLFRAAKKGKYAEARRVVSDIWDGWQDLVNSLLLEQGDSGEA